MKTKAKAKKQPAKKFTVRKAAPRKPVTHDVLLDEPVPAQWPSHEWNDGWNAGYKNGASENDALLRWSAFEETTQPGKYLIVPQEGFSYVAQLVLCDYGNGRKTLTYNAENEAQNIAPHLVKRVYGPIPEEAN